MESQMNIELLKVIVSLCQVTGSYGSISTALTGSSYHDKETKTLEFTYQEAAREQLRCQKYYIKCMEKDIATLDRCILERK